VSCNALDVSASVQKWGDVFNWGLTLGLLWLCCPRRIDFSDDNSQVNTQLFPVLCDFESSLPSGLCVTGLGVQAVAFPAKEGKADASFRVRAHSAA